MKKALSFLLASIMLFSLLSVSALGKDIATTQSNDKSEIESVVQEYLDECARFIFLFEEKDLSRNTFSKTAKALNSIGENTQPAIQSLITYRAENAIDMFSPEPTTLTDFIENLELQEDRVKYLRHINESQNITYDYFNTKYTFIDTLIDGDYAITHVSEELDYQYSFSDMPTYEQFIYNIALVNIDGKWTIAEITSNDPFYIENCNTGFDLKAELQSYDMAQALTDTTILSDPIDVSSTPIPMATGDIRYNKENAINYALTYSSSYDDGTTHKPDWANSNMPWFSANCMNFASQCIWAGLGGSNSSTDIENGSAMDKEGTSTHQWYTEGAEGNSSYSWSSCSNFKAYVDNPVGGEKDLICATSEIASNSNSLLYTPDSLEGAIVQTKGFNSQGNPVALGHVVFINHADGSRRDQVYFTSYNTNWKNKLFSSRYPVTSNESAIDRLYVIIPQYMRGADEGLRLWATLCNSLPSGTLVPINGFANETCSEIKVEVYSPSGTLEYEETFYNTSYISTNHVCSGIGAWKVVLTGTSNSGTQSFTFMVRIY